jgi:2-polyprenyl-6-methoxyphenol hydroxylase-like FAD-dependent oxidoreductase
MRSEPEVLIVGAGPTGLTLAGGLLANVVAAPGC